MYQQLLLAAAFLLLASLPGYAQGVLNKKLTADYPASSLIQRLKDLQRSTGVTIAFDEKETSGLKVPAASFSNSTLKEVLQQILKEVPFSWQLAGESVVIIARPQSTLPTKKHPGRVAGRILDEENGQPVSGVSVRISDKGITSDENGAFALDLPQGKYEAEISSVGYGAKKITNIHIEEGKTFTLDVPLKREKGQLGAVTVSTRRARETGTNAAIVNEIRAADAVVSGISKEQIARSQDRDAADVVRRISGVSIIQNRLVVIRGLPQRYNTVMLNSVIAPSFEPDSRAFSFDIMPSSLIDRVMIYKTAVPELPGDFDGGVIKVYTTDMPVRNSFNVSYTASYNANTTFRDFQEQAQGKKAWLGYDDGTYSMPKSAPGRIDEMSVEKQRQLSREFNDNWNVRQKTAPVDHRFGLDFTQRIALGSKIQLGVIGAFSYSNTYQYSVIAQNVAGMMGGFFTSAYRLVDQSYDHNVRLNGLLNLSLQIGNNHTIGLKQLYTHMGSTNAIVRNGETGEAASDGSGLYAGQYVRQYVLSNAYRGIYSGQLSGTHTVLGATRLSWVAGYTKSRYDDPDQRYRTLKVDTGRYYNDSSLVEPAPTTISSLYKGRRYFTLPEETKTGGLDLVQPVKIHNTTYTLKAGVFFEEKERTFEYRQLGYLPDTVVGLRINEVYGKNNSYHAKNVLKAAYLAAEIPITPQLKLYGGLRIEDNTQELHTYTWQTVGIVNDGRIDLLRNNTSRLPSFNISYAFNDKNLLRAAYSRTLNRPEFREISSFFYMDMLTYRQAYGNENLKIQTNIDNYDLRFEHYPGVGEMFTAGLFYKRFKDPIEFYYYVGTSGYNNFQWGNAVEATSYGAEVELMLGLDRYFTGVDRISRIVQRLSVLFNVAYIHSRVDLGSKAGIQDRGRSLYGQSPYLLNTALNYTDDSLGLKMNVSYNIIGKRLVTVGNLTSPNIYEMPRNSLDISFSKRVGKIFELKGGIQNLLNARYWQVQRAADIEKIVDKTDTTVYGDSIYQSNYTGATFTLGVGLRL